LYDLSSLLALTTVGPNTRASGGLEELGGVVRRPGALIAVTILATRTTTILLVPVVVRKTATASILAQANSAACSVVIMDAVRTGVAVPAYNRDTASVVTELARTLCSSLATVACCSVKRALDVN
jgi:hypothetical protein